MEKKEEKLTVYTAIKPTGRLHLGNYLGVGQGLKDYQKDYNTFFCVADLHAMTMNQSKVEMERLTYSIFSYYIAFGISPSKSTVYVQSQVKEHAELGWILNNFTMMGEASRMTQYKDHIVKGKEVNVGLFDYPVLMAGDILLYDTNIVPVGQDQVQHVEICRDIANRFNNKYGETFIIPNYQVRKGGAKIMGLKNPEKKMSKSEGGDANVIYLDDTDEDIMKKIKRAVTDSDNKIYYDPENKPGVSNLLTIYSLMNKISIKEAERFFKDANYGFLKEQVINAVVTNLRPVKAKYQELMADPEQIKRIMKKGAVKAEKIAREKIKQVKEALGVVVL